MILPDTSRDQWQWDRFHAHHVVHEDFFVQFETGELVFAPLYGVMPRDRRAYPSLGVSLLWSGDKMPDGYEIKTAEGSPVKWSWLSAQVNTNGASCTSSRTFLLDHATKRMVATGWRNEMDPHVPQWLRGRSHNVRAYFAGPGDPPIGKPVTYARSRDYTLDERRRWRQLTLECKAWETLTADNKTKGYQRIDPVLATEKVLGTSLSDMSDALKLKIARKGFVPEHKSFETPWLEVTSSN